MWDSPGGEQLQFSQEAQAIVAGDDFFRRADGLVPVVVVWIFDQHRWSGLRSPMAPPGVCGPVRRVTSAKCRWK